MQDGRDEKRKYHLYPERKGSSSPDSVKRAGIKRAFGVGVKETTMKRWFDWDPRKEQGNLRKHKVSLREAVTIFEDPFILSKFDVDHSEQEDRWISLGISELERLLAVVHTHREMGGNKEIIRLISARRADAIEEAHYRGRRRS
jgi:uncharacterized DUF497 family protein